jgi:dipeptidyl aminopeptidase/acylaminoacyl peptidase
MKQTTSPYGSWKSPITSDLIVLETVRLEQICLDGPDIYWIENRPSEEGRYVIVRYSPDGQITDITPPAFNARTRVHEYGGGSYTVADGVVYFSNFTDQSVYCQVPGSGPQPITQGADLRYADFVIDSRRKCMICVCEDHTDTQREPVNTLVRIDLDFDHESSVLVSGNDFYSSPRLSSDGSHLAWLSWNHPNMPWDGTGLWVGEIKKDGSLGHTELIAGGTEESIFQPEWSPDGTLYFISDRNGWWNLYRWSEKGIRQVCPIEAEFGLPQWVFGLSTYSFESANRIICTYTSQGAWHLAGIDTLACSLKNIDTPYTSIGYVKAAPGCVLFTGGSSIEPISIVRLNIASETTKILRRSSKVEIGIDIDAGYISRPLAVEFPTDKGLRANGFFYAQKNPDFTAPPDERPPLLVMSHGGPTSFTSDTLNLMVQYWTSRGFAVLDVNYGGSTGYGRAYRERLNGQWGIVDVNDCINGARYFVERGMVDGNRLVIKGGSAGGYTVLCALTFHDVFKAGASYYGVSDPEALVLDTHKFESHYLDRLIGPYYKGSELYHERSPVKYSDNLSCPVIFFQGLEDRIVLPDQMYMMVDSLRIKGVPVAYVLFEGEQHGFRRARSIKRSLDAELYFYSKVFGFELAQPVEPVQIENLSSK